MKKFLLAGITVLAFSVSAYATPIISINQPITGSDTFTGNGAGDLSVVQSGITAGGSDTIEPTSGSISISGFSATTGPQALGIFPILGGPTSTLTYTNGVDVLTETVRWTDVDDGSVNPHISGVDTVTAVTGALFSANFFVGQLSTIDLTVNNVGTILDTLALGTSTETAGLSSGELLFSARAVPEPKMLMVMLMAIGTIFMLHKRFSR